MVLAGEIGRQAWVGLSTLVRHPFRGGHDTDDIPAVSSGQAELTDLDRVPADPVRAQALSTALALRAARGHTFQVSSGGRGSTLSRIELKRRSTVRVAFNVSSKGDTHPDLVEQALFKKSGARAGS